MMKRYLPTQSPCRLRLPQSLCRLLYQKHQLPTARAQRFPYPNSERDQTRRIRKADKRASAARHRQDHACQSANSHLADLLQRLRYRHGRQPEEFILIVGRNETCSAPTHNRNPRRARTNPLIRRDFGDLVGSPWTKTETDTRNGIGLRPLGRGSSPRGALLGDVRSDVETV